MKVICIDATVSERAFINESCGEVKEGEVYIVIEECIGMYGDGTTAKCYQLEGFPDWQAFEKNRFIPLSEIDETQLLNQREQLQTA